MIINSNTGRSGWLGDQMHQFAAVYALARKLKARPVLPVQNIADHHEDAWRHLTLYECFNLDPAFLIPDPNPAPVKIHESTQGMFYKDPLFWEQTDNTDIRGYTQGLYFFGDYLDEIRQLYTFRQSVLNPATAIWQERFRHGEWCDMHVRHGGDVVRLNWQRSVAYYTGAIEEMRRLHPGVKIILFTDDPPWAWQNWGQVPDLVFAYPGQPYLDLCLRTFCHHHIINSGTFSWWGAVLGKHQGGTVIAPAEWVPKWHREHDPRERNTEYLYLPHWTRFQAPEDHF